MAMHGVSLQNVNNELLPLVAVAVVEAIIHATVDAAVILVALLLQLTALYSERSGIVSEDVMAAMLAQTVTAKTAETIQQVPAVMRAVAVEASSSTAITTILQHYLAFR
jgi:hypothetical protein